MILRGDINDSRLVGAEVFEHAKSTIASCSDELFAIWCVAEECRSRGVLILVSKDSNDRECLGTDEQDVLVIWQPSCCFCVGLICPSSGCHNALKALWPTRQVERVVRVKCGPSGALAL